MKEAFSSKATRQDKLALLRSLFNAEFYDHLEGIAKSMTGTEMGCNRPTPTRFDRENPTHQDLGEAFMEMVTSLTRSGTLQPVEFDKENELHLRIVTLLADVKSDCFKISTKNFDKWRVQRIAGHSIPSIISSTAIAAALNCLNLYAIAARKCGATNTRLVNYMGSLSNFGFQRDFGLATEGEEVVEVIVPAGEITLKEIRKHITLSFSSWFTEEMRDFDMHKIKIQFLREHVECNLFKKLS